MKWRPLFSDLILWLVLVGVFWGGSHFLFTLPNRQRQVITLQFHDANEIIRGTNVRLMGVDVGYVDDVAIEDEHVNVKIQMTRDAIQIPEGTTATIKFTGLVGSKSLELMPPDKVKDLGPSMKAPNTYVIVEEPIRLRDTIQYNIDIAKALQHGAENFSDFFGRRKPIEELQYNALRSQKKTEVIVGFLDRSLANLVDFHGRFQVSRSDYRRVFYHLEAGSLKTVEILDRKIFGASVQPVLNYFDDVFDEAQRRLTHFRHEGSAELRERIVQAGNRLIRDQKKVQAWNPVQRSGQWLLGVEKWNGWVHQMDRIPSKEEGLPKLRRVRRSIQKANKGVMAMDERM